MWTATATAHQRRMRLLMNLLLLIGIELGCRLFAIGVAEISEARPGWVCRQMHILPTKVRLGLGLGVELH